MSSRLTSGCVACTDERRRHTPRDYSSHRLSRARVRASAFSILPLLAVPHAALAAATTPPDTSLPTTGFLQVLVALGLVLAAIAAFYHLAHLLARGAADDDVVYAHCHRALAAQAGAGRRTGAPQPGARGSVSVPDFLRHVPGARTHVHRGLCTVLRPAHRVQ